MNDTRSRTGTGACGWVAALLLVAGPPMASGDAHANTSCVPLQRLVGLADTRFDRLRGYFDPRLRTWVATYRMPGASLCTIRDEDDIAYYSCRWAHDPKAATASGHYTELLQLVTRCVDVRGSSQQDIGPGEQVTRYGVADGRKTVVVGRNEAPGGGHFVTLDIVPIGLTDFPAQ